MQRCWAERPQDRPSFEQVAADLRRIIELLPASTRSTAEEEDELAC